MAYADRAARRGYLNIVVSKCECQAACLEQNRLCLTLKQEPTFMLDRHTFRLSLHFINLMA